MPFFSICMHTFFFRENILGSPRKKRCLLARAYIFLLLLSWLIDIYYPHLTPLVKKITNGTANMTPENFHLLGENMNAGIIFFHGAKSFGINHAEISKGQTLPETKLEKLKKKLQKFKPRYFSSSYFRLQAIHF